MEWFSDLLTFVSGSTGKAITTLVGMAVSFMGAGLWIGKTFGKNKRLVDQRKIRSLDDQFENAQKSLQKAQRHSASLAEELESKRREEALSRQQLAELNDKYEMAKKKLIPYYQAYIALKPRAEQLYREHKAEKQLVAQLASDKGEHEKAIIDLRTNLDEREKRLELIELRTRKALKLKGNLWAAKALQARPKFVSLSERKVPIVSILNLKGGVGKTTVTSQLGIALAQMGYRVLLVDLDFQGSLTHMFFPLDIQKTVANDQRLVHHFLELASDDKTTKLLEFLQTPKIDVSQKGGKLGLIAASDDLAYTELNLTLKWLLRRGQRDNRFLLRKALHVKSITREYDIVLLDCPPIVNISCINALAASDYLLLPVTMTRSVMDRVPILLKRFLRNPMFINHINHQLRVLGILANRTHRDEFSGSEREDWKLLSKNCKDAYGQDIKQFTTIIQQLNREIRDYELVTEQKLDSKLSQLFAALAAEIIQELPNECRRNATTLS